MTIPALPFVVPRWAWIVLASAFLFGVLVWAHQREVKQTIAAAEKRGEDRAYANVAKKTKELERKANDLTEKIKERNREENSRITAAADDLRLRGPGKARANCPGVPSGPSRRQPADGQANAAGPGVPSGEFATVPWGWLIERAEKCDLNRAESLAWREWYAKQSELWAKPAS